MTGLNIAMLAAASIAALLALGGAIYALLFAPPDPAVPGDGIVTELPSDWLYGDPGARTM